MLQRSATGRVSRAKITRSNHFAAHRPRSTLLSFSNGAKADSTFHSRRFAVGRGVRAVKLWTNGIDSDAERTEFRKRWRSLRIRKEMEFDIRGNSTWSCWEASTRRRAVGENNCSMLSASLTLIRRARTDQLLRQKNNCRSNGFCWRSRVEFLYFQSLSCL